uniref:phage baseplate assembly protein V n=1 Tax=Flavobacterium sp. TaxID=239 RepID=UPI00286DDF02
IQVQMAWQKNNSEKTPWIRMTNPHAGGGKGMYFIPEIGEEVLIGFESDNAEKPFVMGTMYNGAESSGFATADNSFKVIKTQSGHYLEFEELKNIKLADKKGNIFHIDSTGDTINIKALKTINLEAENINFIATQNITSNAGKDLILQAGNDIKQTATGNMLEYANSKQEIVENKITTQSAEYNEVSEKITMNTTKENMTFKASKTIKVNSGEKSNFH